MIKEVFKILNASFFARGEEKKNQNRQTEQKQDFILLLVARKRTFVR